MARGFATELTPGVVLTLCTLDFAPGTIDEELIVHWFACGGQ